MLFLRKIMVGKRGRKEKDESLRRRARSVGRAYGVKLNLREERDVENWLMCRDPYMAELFCEG